MSLILSGTDGLSDVDGSAATPAIRGTDANTGIFFPAADTIAFAEGGVECARFDSSGNFGIGGTPSKKLQVTSSDVTDGIRLYSSDTGGEGLSLEWMSAFGSNRITADIESDASGAGGNFAIRVADTSAVLQTRLLIDNGGNLGIGTSSPSFTAGSGGLMISGLKPALRLSSTTTGAGTWEIYADSASAGGLGFYERQNAQTMMYLDEGGNLGIGTTSPSAKLQVDASNFALATSYNTLSSNFAVRTTTTQAANVGGEIALGGYTNGTSSPCDFARIHGKKENGTAGNVSGYLAFEVSYDGGPSPYIFERARIDSSGNLLVGTTTSSARFTVQGAVATSASYAAWVTNSATTILFAVRNDGYISIGTAAASPYNNTTGSAANLHVDSNGSLLRSTSSLKYKTNVQDATHGLADLLQLRSVTYEGKSEADAGKTFGVFIAEEVHEAGLTEFVQYAEDGSPDALAYGNMVSLCIKAIQEQQALITTLTARITALESA